MSSVPCILFTDDSTVVDTGIALRLPSGYPLKNWRSLAVVLGLGMMAVSGPPGLVGKSSGPSGAGYQSRPHRQLRLTTGDDGDVQLHRRR